MDCYQTFPIISSVAVTNQVDHHFLKQAYSEQRNDGLSLVAHGGHLYQWQLPCCHRELVQNFVLMHFFSCGYERIPPNVFSTTKPYSMMHWIVSILQQFGKEQRTSLLGHTIYPPTSRARQQFTIKFSEAQGHCTMAQSVAKDGEQANGAGFRACQRRALQPVTL